MKPTALQMSKDNQGSYYAVTDSSSEPIKGSAQNHEIATVSLTGGDDGVSYNCTANLTITVSGAMASVLTEEDAFITLNAERSTGFTSISSLPIKNIVDSAETYTDMQVAFSLKSGDTTNTSKITGDVWLVNTASQQNNSEGENDISNKELSVEIKLDDFACDIAEGTD